MRVVAATILLAFAAACGSSPAQPAAGDRGSSTPVASGSSTLVTPEPNPTGSRTGTPTPKKTETPTPDETGTVTVTESDAGKTIQLSIGQKLEVRLPAEYVQPASGDDAVLARTSASGGYPGSRPVIALFDARNPGRTNVEASTDYACLHATPSCALPQRSWSVNVTVTR